jgi:disulfide bond formation protein DsbB
MFKKLSKLSNLSANKWYWLAILILGVSLEATALVYQYILDYMPCVLCIHVRIWVLAIIVISLLSLMLYKQWQGLLVMQLSMTVIGVGLLERSYRLLGTERGFLSGGCSMDSGLPQWFALDKWWPMVFEVQEPCGYTPELLLGITMAEALLVFSALLLLLSMSFVVSLLITHRKT